MRVWVYYDSAVKEAVVYEDVPPASFGRRGHDIGPIELDGDLVKEYRSAREAWHDAHGRFVSAVRDAQRQGGID